MSTSPSWFDQDKFSRLVKKVGPKTPAGGSAVSGKVPLKPLVKEAQLAPGTKEPEPEPRISLLPPQAQLPHDEKEPEPEPKASVRVTEAQLPPEEVKEETKDVKIPATVSRAPAVERPPSESKRLTSRLPKIDRNMPPLVPVPESTPNISEEAPPIPPPIHSDAGAPVEDEIEEVEKSQATEEVPAEPAPISRPPLSQRMMTSQPLSLGKLVDAGPAFPSKSEPKTEPIRAPEPAPSNLKAPPLPGGVTSSKLPQRTTPLPALKSLFQYEIPGGQGVIPGKLPVSEPPPLKPALPTFSFEKPAAKKLDEPLPPIAEKKEYVPTVPVVADAGHLAELEKELTPETLAAQWGKADGLQEELDRVTKERDDALANNEALEKQLQELREKSASTTAPEKPVVDAAEIEFLTRERDESRSEYMQLREDFEKLKQEQLQAKEAPEPAAAGPDPELEKKIEKLQNDWTEKDRELRAAKLQLREIKDAPKVPDPEMQKELEKLRQDIENKDRELEAKDRDLGLVRMQLQDMPKGPDPEMQKELEKLRQDIGNKDRELEFVKAQLDDVPEPGNPEAEKEIEKLKADLAEKEREMVALKIAAGQTDVAMDKLKEEIVGVRNEVKKAQNEAAVAQRGLALSQKALQETRDALREASESSNKK